MASHLARLTRERSLLLVCGLQERFRPLIRNFPAVVHTAKLMMDAAAILELPIVVTEQYREAFGATGAELDASLASVVEDKTRFSMCTPSVVKALSEPPFAKRTSALLLGIEGHVCIQQTCLDLLEQGYDVHLLVDGIASQRDLDCEVSLKRLEKSAVVIATAEAVLFELMHDSIYERFKEVSRLIVESNRAACAAVET